MKRRSVLAIAAGLVVAAGAFRLYELGASRAHDEPPSSWTPAAADARVPWEAEDEADVLKDGGRLDSWRLWAKVTSADVDASARDAKARARPTIERDYMAIVRKCYAKEPMHGHLHARFAVGPSGAVQSLAFSPALASHPKTPACLTAFPHALLFPPAEYAMDVTVFFSFDRERSP